MVNGRCLCGEVTWQADGPLSEPEHCHCSMCRKIHAAPFASFALCPEKQFRWLSGEDKVVRYASSPSLERPFCGTCGSALPNRDLPSGDVYLPLGNMEDDPGIKGGRHIFVASKAPFVQIEDDLPRYDGFPPGDDETPPVDPAPVVPEPAEAGVMNGSCQCGAVAYEMTGAFQRVFNCHCSRCRHARAAAHATNGFVPSANLQFVRGEEHLKSYKRPDAKSFGQVFCGICGSGMPRENAAMQVYNVPLGTLDNDPEYVPDFHIFTESKAPWFDIHDQIPQLPEGPF